MDASDRARDFLRSRYPTAEVGVLGGSAATGAATATSDLDVLVVLPERWSETAFVETTEHDGQLVEAFVYGPAALQTWLEKGRRERRPVLDRIIGDGLALTEGLATERLAEASRAVLAAGPGPVGPDELRSRRYVLSAVLDDLDTADAAERTAIAMTAWREAAELSLCLQPHWLGTGKWLVRELRRSGDRYGLASWAAEERFDVPQLLAAGRSVLDAAGGYLQSGFTRGVRPSDL